MITKALYWILSAKLIGFIKSLSFSIFNFSKANWDALNHDLSRISWDSYLKSCDIHLAWPRFKSILKSLCDKHIPTIKVKNKSSRPWFDSEFISYARRRTGIENYLNQLVMNLIIQNLKIAGKTSSSWSNKKWGLTSMILLILVLIQKCYGHMTNLPLILRASQIQLTLVTDFDLALLRKLNYLMSTFVSSSPQPVTMI